MKTYLAPITLSLCLAMAVACYGQTYTPDMDNGADWTIVADEDTNFEFGFVSPIRSTHVFCDKLRLVTNDTCF